MIVGSEGIQLFYSVFPGISKQISNGGDNRSLPAKCRPGRTTSIINGNFPDK